MTEPTDIAARREAWRYQGGDRPDFAVEPGPGQESVWDYPRPPAFYLPPEAMDPRWLRPSSNRTFCEWKGEAGTGHW